MEGKNRLTPIFTVLTVVLVGVIIVFAASLIVREIMSQGGKTYYVAPSGDDMQTGTDKAKPLASIQKAFGLAQPGDTIELAEGEYWQNIHSVRNGKAKSPITLKGPEKAVLKGDDAYNRIVEITHDYLHLEGFAIDGLVGKSGTKADYRDKLIYAQGTEQKAGVKGLKISHLKIENAGGECVRLRYFAVENEIANNEIRNCGAYDFVLGEGGKNGEGIYIGTAPEQRKDGRNPDAGPDKSTKNWVHHNTIHTNGNECVDIKEASTENIVEYNTCSGQKDPESAGLDARGNKNIFRYNTVRDNIGAGVRLGGDEETDGIDNEVYENKLKRNASGAIKIMRLPQGKICGNAVEPPEGFEGEDDESGIVDPTVPCDE